MNDWVTWALIAVIVLTTGVMRDAEPAELDERFYCGQGQEPDGSWRICDCPARGPVIRFCVVFTTERG